MDSDDDGLGWNLDFYILPSYKTELGVNLVSYLDENNKEIMNLFFASENTIDSFDNCHKTLKSVEGKRLKITVEVIED